MTDDLRVLLTQPVLEVAPALLGRVVEHRTADGLVAVRLTEVEAYDGSNDPGSHAYRGRTARNAVMFGPPGHLYVYFTYGMHWCINLVCGPDGQASAVLLRAGEVIAGEELARSRRPAARSARDLARGPARLAQALGVDRAGNGLDIFAPSSPVRLGPGEQTAGTSIRRGPRVGLAAAADRPWRFWVDGEPTVSAYRPHAPKRRRSVAEPPGSTTIAPGSGTLGVDAATTEPSIRPRKEPR
ncbi:DNA-3-methyladenine glycosylase [Actinopolymorpha cephalotaxi]|uniref:Putative 3-methyladenine DNA glycosylase n=1 Tax=Actinopolymorpha cephalotaxi TaxID=504797 RepID=A0A1I2TY57_9ACTN|nr:DNA-3-methyladenine glycosylase [Actinopolymorpha cephalotaxi]NYH83195.1 DNA-3-methyladenine glycosylase [Actinopolymorpha cephalotaxi]SFG67536.1 DNA-3-methyladenine glycosylase [Actinopolymorpha cephalotaxi]